MAGSPRTSIPTHRRSVDAPPTARHLRDHLKPVLDVLQPLNREMQAKVAGIIRGVGEKALAVQKEQQRQKDAQRQQERGGYSR